MLDTNMVTAYLKKNPLVIQRMRQVEATNHLVMLNAVSHYETRHGILFAGTQVQRTAFERLRQALGIVMMDRTVLDKAA